MFFFKYIFCREEYKDTGVYHCMGLTFQLLDIQTAGLQSTRGSSVTGFWFLCHVYHPQPGLQRNLHMWCFAMQVCLVPGLSNL